MKKHLIFILIIILLNSCVGSSSVGIFGSGVSVAYDPRTVGMQIDDSIMQKFSCQISFDRKKISYFCKHKSLRWKYFFKRKGQ